ncbi:MAG: DUF362 domain-containing protein [Verrucomicrobia bacterium]|jgi:uncharacterized protein (DUF362 family)/NAD-dependent dihydropyrimidine dehydrogenase PreA subunit|nr:DUF362 domain-containing protein [Verrucomicrobiota bacterium]MBT7067337.1 DUF362 domain-containing protein [Verrucomicrobiota bacterium]MBT7699522.1 DUF362 domain-containing protein [Verrucomicrobiota bacterium]
MTNPDPKTIVAFERCPDYEPAAVEAAVRAVLEPLGGMAAFVQPGQTVLLKPNLLTDSPPEDAITTHPEVVRAVIRLVREAGAPCRVSDSPASVIKLERVWERTGMRALCEEEGVELVTLEVGGARTFREKRQVFDVATRVLEADVVINLPKVKTHVLTSLTCGVKNMYGCVPGMRKAGLHKQYFNAADFGRVVAAIYSTVRPALTIADGVVGMTGNGPSSGEVTPMGFVAASADGVALDRCLCDVLGINPRSVPYFSALKRRGVGEQDPGRIALRGVDPSTLLAGPVPLPNTLRSRLVPTWLGRLLAPLLWCRPTFSDACIFCGLCVRTCPAEALAQRKGEKPVLTPSKCIECCCCHEVCPANAIDMQLSPMFERLKARDKCLR